MKKHVYLLKDLDCADCANKIQQELSKNENLKNVTVNFNTLKLIYETDILTKEDVEKIKAYSTYGGGNYWYGQ